MFLTSKDDPLFVQGLCFLRMADKKQRLLFKRRSLLQSKCVISRVFCCSLLNVLGKMLSAFHGPLCTTWRLGISLLYTASTKHDRELHHHSLNEWAGSRCNASSRCARTQYTFLYYNDSILEFVRIEK